jgi:hypothetical protein
MAFYIIERLDQLEKLGDFEDCFVSFIPKNYNFHPTLTELSLVYVRDFNQSKGYMLCIDHNESFGLDIKDVKWWLLSSTKKMWVADKKEALYYFYQPQKLFDVNFISHPVHKSMTNCSKFYYDKHYALPNVNCLISISKHYEECENLFNKVAPAIISFKSNDQFTFNNERATKVFYQLESNGIKLNKDCFIDYYQGKLPHPEFNLSRGKIYTHYNLYTTTSRPSNTFNSVNFAALNKDDGERMCYMPENDMFIEMDFQGYHPRIIGEMVNWSFPNHENTYSLLGEILGVTQQDAKELTFKQLYGGVWSKYQYKPFFKDVNTFIDNMWDTYQYGGKYETKNRTFVSDADINRNKLFNYIVQSKETSTNVELLEKVLDYLIGKKTKIVLYTYDAFLFDYSKEDGNILQDIVNMLEYPITIKQGNTYHGLTKI